MTTFRLDIRQIFAAPVLWMFIATVTAFMYPVLGLPLLAICVACLYWAFKAAFFSKCYTHFLGGILLFGVGAGIAFLLIGCVMLSEQFFHVPRSRSYLTAPIGLFYFGIWFCFFQYRQRRHDWNDFQSTRKNRYLSAVGTEVVWLRKGRSTSPAVVSICIGGGLALITITGGFVGKANAQAAVAALSVICLPILTLGYGMHVIIGLSELRRLERATGTRFPLPDVDQVQRIRAANWIGRQVNPELRAIYRADRQTHKEAASRAYPRSKR